MISLPRITPLNIFEGFWNASTIAWAAIWAVVLHMSPRIWKHRGMIVNEMRDTTVGMLTFMLQSTVVSFLGFSLIYRGVLSKPYTESELARWKEMGILLRKTEHWYRWRLDESVQLIRP